MFHALPNSVRPPAIDIPMMKKPSKVVIVTHRRHPLRSQRYLINLMAAEWRREGIEFKELCGADRFEDADVAVQHVNLTVVPDEYRQLLARYPVVVNGRALDVSKSHVSTSLVGPDDDYPGPVIVKTNLNFGGRPEEIVRRSEPFWQRGWNRLVLRLTGRRPSLTRTTRTLRHYPIFGSIADVPEAVFGNPHLVVEKFLPEFQEGCYWLRKYLFFGQCHLGSRSAAQARIVKAGNTLRSEEIPVPNAIHERRAELGFDYGKFDYVVHDGQPVLLDANRTPTYRTPKPTERVKMVARKLAAGIASLRAA